MLKRIFDFLFHSCRHTYVVIDTMKKSLITYVNGEDNLDEFYIYINRCSKCGKIEEKRVGRYET